ncbi:MAG: hypothetical protein ACYTG0_41865 [Planctomycetota bacterium]|jgi:hypothetical protein
MTVVRQSQWEDLDGFQVDWRQFHIPYHLGSDIVEVFSYGLRDACEAEDRLAVCAIVWLMLVANGLSVPPRTYACRCDPREVGSLVTSLRFEALHGEQNGLRKLLIEAARAAGIYGPYPWVPIPRSDKAATVLSTWAIGPSKN